MGSKDAFYATAKPKLTLWRRSRHKGHCGGDDGKEGNDLNGLHGGDACWAQCGAKRACCWSFDGSRSFVLNFRVFCVVGVSACQKVSSATLMLGC